MKKKQMRRIVAISREVAQNAIKIADGAEARSNRAFALAQRLADELCEEKGHRMLAAPAVDLLRRFDLEVCARCGKTNEKPFPTMQVNHAPISESEYHQ